MQTYPNIVKNWIEYDDKDRFEPLTINCAVEDIANVEDNSGKLTTLVTYYTRYTSSDKLPILLLFGLGKGVAVNAIIGEPTLKEWKGVIYFVRDCFTSIELILTFDMEYKMANT